MSAAPVVILSRADGEGPLPFRCDVREAQGTLDTPDVAEARALALRGPSPSARLGMTHAESAHEGERL